MMCTYELYWVIINFMQQVVLYIKSSQKVATKVHQHVISLPFERIASAVGGCRLLRQCSSLRALCLTYRLLSLLLI